MDDSCKNISGFKDKRTLGDSSGDSALEPPPINTNPGVQYADAARSFQGIPGIECCGNGRLWAVWYGGGTWEGSENYVLTATSGNNGRSWSSPRLVIDPANNVRAFDPTLWHDPAGRLWIFWTQSHYLWDGRGGIWAMMAENSDTENPRWDKPRRLGDGVVLNKPIVLTNGEWILPAVIWCAPVSPGLSDQHKHIPPDRDMMHLLVSADEGKTWKPRGEVFISIPNKEIPGQLALEPMVVQRRDQSLWMLIRTPFGIAESVSRDEGKTWTQAEPSNIPHIYSARFYIRRLTSGRLLLVRHNPPDLTEKGFAITARSHLTAFLSDNDGATWYGGLLLDERLTVSYPDGVEGPGRALYVIYDFERKDAKEILMAVLTEEDIVCGRCVSSGSRLRVLVNKATGQVKE